MAVLVRAYGQVEERFVGAWADAHALTLTSENRPMVGWYLRNARVLRTWGGLGGLFIAPIVRLSLSDVQLLRWTMWIPGAVGPPSALAVCLSYGHCAWKVQRPNALSVRATRR